MENKLDDEGEALGGAKVYREDFLSFDRHRRHCVYCGEAMISEGSKKNLQGWSHTLKYGTNCIAIHYNWCPHCHRLNFYDGLCDAIFEYRIFIVFSIDLLDFWVYGIGAFGGTLLEVYELSQRVSSSPSAKHTRFGVNSLSCKRQTANRALNAYKSIMA